MSNHYIFLKPGETIYVISDMIIGDAHYYTTVIELDLPSEEHDGELFHVAPKDGKIQAYRHARLELNDCANMTCEGETLDRAYARHNESRMRTGRKPWVSAPIAAFNEVQLEPSMVLGESSE